MCVPHVSLYGKKHLWVIIIGLMQSYIQPICVICIFFYNYWSISKIFYLMDSVIWTGLCLFILKSLVILRSMCSVYFLITKLRPQWDAKENVLYDTSTQFDEQRDQVAVEQILRVVFLDPERPTPVSMTEISSTLIFHLRAFVCIISFFLLWRHWKNLSDSWLRQRQHSRHARSLQKRPVHEFSGKDLLLMNGWGNK